jgi:hypothetical protein
MSFLAIAFPAQAAVPVAQTFVNYARPFLGLSALITLLMIFKPLVLGIIRAAWLTIKPRQSLEQRNARRKLFGVMMLNRMANEYDRSQPNLAAELRLLAGRG